MILKLVKIEFPKKREKSHRKSAAREEKAMMALREFSSQSPE